MPWPVNLFLQLIKNIENAILNTKTAADTARYLNMDYKYLRRICENLNIFLPKNQSKKGLVDIKKLNDILNNAKYCKPYDLKEKLVNVGYLENKCYCCGLENWMDKKITFHLHHIKQLHHH